ncbi:MAG: hypothetical protein SOT80_04475 [Candidatus Pseudoruminococcus sp.]|nr:hypothetical protein [Ruminococcus sp.]MDY2782645.1 hypothetical protein [Candidatus Pseudoruminococcus sp.]
MLGRLFKYEIKATSKILVPIYIAFIAITAISRISIELQVDKNSPLYFISDIGFLIFMLSAMTIFVATAIVIVWRFYRNTSSYEGYLLFTLPVKTDYIIISEFLCAFLWSIVMSVVVVIGIFLMIFNSNVGGITINFPYFKEFFSSLNFDGGKVIFIMLLDMTISTLAEIMAIYCAISLASLFKKYRLMLSVLFYIGLVIITNTLDILVIRIITHNFIPQTETISETYDTATFAEAWNSLIVPSLVSEQVIIDLIFLITITVVEYFIVRKILRKHLNIC